MYMAGARYETHRTQNRTHVSSPSCPRMLSIWHPMTICKSVTRRTWFPNLKRSPPWYPSSASRITSTTGRYKFKSQNPQGFWARPYLTRSRDDAGKIANMLPEVVGAETANSVGCLTHEGGQTRALRTVPASLLGDTSRDVCRCIRK